MYTSVVHSLVFNRLTGQAGGWSLVVTGAVVACHVGLGWALVRSFFGGPGVGFTAKLLKIKYAVAAWWYHERSLRSPLDVELLNSLRSLQLPKAAIDYSNPHANLASDRSSVRSKLLFAITENGRAPYVIQLGERDVDAMTGKFFDGRLIHYTARDHVVPSKAGAVKSDHVKLIVDCDHYFDLNSELLMDPLVPLVIYTTIPETVGATRENWFYCFKDGKFIAQVNAPANLGDSGENRVYEHELWNYDFEFYSVGSVTYKCYQIDAGQDRRIVYVMPWSTGRSSPGFVRWSPRVFSVECNGVPIRYLAKVNRAGVCSLAIEGESRSLNLPVYILNDMQSTYNESPKSFTAGFAKHKLCEKYNVAQPHEISLLKCYLQHHRIDSTGTYGYSVPPVLFYGAKPKNEDWTCFDREPAAFMAPLVAGNYMPIANKENVRWCVNERVVKPQKNALATPFTAQGLLFIHEFADYISAAVLQDNGGYIVPAQIEEIAAQQDKPNQRKLIEEAFWSKWDTLVKLFVKAEYYAEVKPPRAISPDQPALKIGYARYMSALSKALQKAFPWYCVGYNLNETMEKLAGVMNNSSAVQCSDASKHDGTVLLLRLLERRIAVKTVHPAYVQDFCGFHSMNIACSGKWSAGEEKVDYETGGSVRSGSRGTTPWNTIITVFLAYVGYRLQGCTPKEAKESLRKKALAHGDDLCAGDLNNDSIAKSYKMFGMLCKPNLIARGELGVSFLARYISPDAWFSIDQESINSCTDPMRAITKIHCLTTKLYPPRGTFESTELFMAYNKLNQLVLTDRNTPVIKDVLDAWERLFPELQPGKGNKTVPVDRLSKDLQYVLSLAGDGGRSNLPVNVEAEWMVDILAKQTPHAANLIKAVNKHFSKCNRTTFFQFRTFVPLKIKPPQGVVVRGKGVEAVGDGPADVPAPEKLNEAVLEKLSEQAMVVEHPKGEGIDLLPKAPEKSITAIAKAIPTVPPNVVKDTLGEPKAVDPGEATVQGATKLTKTKANGKAKVGGRNRRNHPPPKSAVSGARGSKKK